MDQERGAPPAPSTLLAAYDAAPLTPTYWASMALVSLQTLFDYFDFFVVGFLVAALAPAWHLTFFQSSAMLLTAGVGSIVGSLALGRWADRVGRKPALIVSAFVIAAGSLMLALVPQGSWLLFSLARTILGIGLGGATSIQTVLTVELTPTRHRTFLASLLVTPAAFGVLLASLLAAALMPVIGWRGLAAIGTVPALVGLAMIPVLPESTRWLLSSGRAGEAARAARKQTGLALPPPTVAAGRLAPRPRMAELGRHRGALGLLVVTWLGMSTALYGSQLWAPTIVALTLALPVKTVAGYFIVSSLAGIAGRLAFSALPLAVGRWRSGVVMGAGAAIGLLVAGFDHARLFGHYPAFMVWFGLAAFFISGGFANMGPYVPETFPVNLGGSAAALSQAVNGVGKIVGPLVLGLLAGGGDLVTPKATAAAIVPGFAFLAACCAASAIAYGWYRIEPHGRAQALGAELAAEAT